MTARALGSAPHSLLAMLLAMIGASTATAQSQSLRLVPALPMPFVTSERLSEPRMPYAQVENEKEPREPREKTPADPGPVAAPAPAVAASPAVATPTASATTAFTQLNLPPGSWDTPPPGVRTRPRSHVLRLFCRGPVCSPCNLPHYGFYDTCWKGWPYPTDWNHCTLPGGCPGNLPVVAQASATLPIEAAPAPRVLPSNGTPVPTDEPAQKKNGATPAQP